MSEEAKARISYFSERPRQRDRRHHSSRAERNLRVFDGAGRTLSPEKDPQSSIAIALSCTVSRARVIRDANALSRRRESTRKSRVKRPSVLFFQRPNEVLFVRPFLHRDLKSPQPEALTSFLVGRSVFATGIDRARRRRPFPLNSTRIRYRICISEKSSIRRGDEVSLYSTYRREEASRRSTLEDRATGNKILLIRWNTERIFVVAPTLMQAATRPGD